MVRAALEEKRLRQEHQRAQQELLRSNRDLEQFAYVASHDLQEPLRIVAIFTQLLPERLHGKLDEEAERYMGFISEGALRMQAMIEDLLTFSRLGRGGLNTRRDRLQPGRLEGAQQSGGRGRGKRGHDRM